MHSSKPRVKLITLGCPKNEVDSEEIAGVLRQAGCVLDGAAETSDVTIINTCGFIESGKNESIEFAKEAIAAKKRGRTGKVIIAGCLVQRFWTEIESLAPGADAYVGVGQMGRFSQIVEGVVGGTSSRIDLTPPQHRWADVGVRARTGKPWSAYLKVSEGCDHQCTFCTIPSFRGKHQSKPLERVLAEAQALAESGAKELNLVAQDLSQYGFDLYREYTLPKLLRELAAVEGVEWIRMLYLYPSRVTPELIETMASTPKVLPYVDMPLQHAHPETLRRMKRPWDGDRYLKLFDQLRAAMPTLAIRSTFIVGFPGETDAEFETLLQFVRGARLDRVGVFPYSREPGTPSYDMPGQVAFRDKRRRYERLMGAQRSVSLEVGKGWIGKSLPVLMENQKEKWSVGRSFRDAPEIDGAVFVKGEHRAGEFLTVHINDADAYDLFAGASEPIAAGASSGDRESR